LLSFLSEEPVVSQSSSALSVAKQKGRSLEGLHEPPDSGVAYSVHQWTCWSQISDDGSKPAPHYSSFVPCRGDGQY
jgi:hypothetical protein